MKKANIPEEDEAFALTEATTALIQRFLEDFVKQSTRKGHIEISKESPKFVITMRLERKKEAR